MVASSKASTKPTIGTFFFSELQETKIIITKIKGRYF
jgi:hypothetical protein